MQYNESVSKPVSKQECIKALEECGVPPADKLVQYMAMLLEINESVNLTGAKTPKEFALKHIADVWGALHTIGALERPVVDVGSGGGLPGIVLGIFSPNTSITLVERRQKKAAALDHLISKLGLEGQVKVIARSFEEIRSLPTEAEIWMRGFLPGPKLAVYFSQAFPRADLGQIVLMKGPAWSEEKLNIMNEAGVRDGWKQRFASAEEMEYALPEEAGRRVLVLV